jgi:hypothetical protein
MSAFGTFETSTDVRYTAAFGGKPDIEETSPNDRVRTPSRDIDFSSAVSIVLSRRLASAP